MTSWESSTRRYSLGRTVDLQEFLEEYNIEFLDVDDTRAVVILGGAILNIEIDGGSLDSVDVLEVAVVEPPPDVDPTDQEAISDFLDDFVDRVTTRIDTTVTHHD